MANPNVRAWHEEGMAQARERVMLRIQQGTKASSPAALSARWARHDFKGLPDNSTGSKNRPFFINPDQSDKVLEPKPLQGGVLRDYKYARMILDRRAKEFADQDMRKAGITPPAPAALELTPDESRSLELNTLLQLLQDSVETGSVADITSLMPDLKNILRLFITLLPTFTAQQLGDFQEFFQNMIEDLESMEGDMEGRNTAVTQARRFSASIYNLIARYAPYVNASDRDKAAAIKIFLKENFKLEPRELAARPGVLGQQAAAMMAEEGVAPAEGEEEAAAAEAASMGAPSLDESISSEEVADLRAEVSNLLGDADLETLRAIYDSVMARPRVSATRPAAEYRLAIRRRLRALTPGALVSLQAYLGAPAPAAEA